MSPRSGPPYVLWYCLAMLMGLAGYLGFRHYQRAADAPPVAAPADGQLRRVPIQGFQVTFYRVSDGTKQWAEVAIAVDRSDTLRMPVFFTEHGQMARGVTDAEADALIAQWLKQRARGVAVYTSLATGMNGPFLAIDRSNPNP